MKKRCASLARLALRPELTGTQLETRTLCGAVARGILDAIQAAQADLLVMSRHGRSGFTRFAFGSVTEAGYPPRLDTGSRPAPITHR